MADKTQRSTRAGQYYGSFTGGNIETLIYTGAGVAQAYFTVTAGTATATFYDGTQSTGGTIIHLTNQTMTAGTTQNVLEIPFSSGLVVKGTTGSAALVVTYLAAGINGTTVGA